MGTSRDGNPINIRRIHHYDKYRSNSLGVRTGRNKIYLSKETEQHVERSYPRVFKFNTDSTHLCSTISFPFGSNHWVGFEELLWCSFVFYAHSIGRAGQNFGQIDRC